MIIPPLTGVLPESLLSEFEAWLQLEIAKWDLHPRLREIYNYTLFSSGKRFRPQLVFLTGWYLEVPFQKLFPLAGAVEMIHNYSLIHDDLPAMDNALERRGRAAVHLRFAEDLAILAGDGLLTDAFFLIASTPALPGNLLIAIAHLARAAGGQGMVAGQVGDLYELIPSQNPDEATLRRVHRLKTGALIEASLLLPFWTFFPHHPELTRFQEYASALGVSYQIGDDLLDECEGTGKDYHRDKGKVTYRTFLSPSKLQEYCQSEYRRVESLLGSFPAHVRKVLLDLLRWTLERHR